MSLSQEGKNIFYSGFTVLHFFFFLQTKTLQKLNVGSLVILSRDGAHLSPGS